MTKKPPMFYQKKMEATFDKRFGLGVYIHTKDDITLDKAQLFDFIRSYNNSFLSHLVKKLPKGVYGKGGEIGIYDDGYQEALNHVRRLLEGEKIK